MSRTLRFLSFLLGLLLLGFLVRVLSWQEALSLEGASKVDYFYKTMEGASDYKVRIAAAGELGKYADGSVADWMARAFRREENPAVRLAILYAIGQIPDHRILPPLLELAQQELLKEGELLAIERILWNFRAAVAAESWERAVVESSDRSERAMAAWLTGVIGRPSGLHVLLAASRDRDPYVRLRALLGITLLGMKEAIPFCDEIGRTDTDPLVARTATNGSSILQQIERGDLPMEKNHKVDLKIDLYGLIPQSVTPELFRDYLGKNVNPRPIEIAASSLHQPSLVEERGDRTVPLVNDERFRRTLRLDASLRMNRPVGSVDADRLREVIRNRAPEVNRCYVEGLKRNRHLGGTVSLRLRIGADGNVPSVESIGATLPDAEVRACIESKVREIRFPPIPIDLLWMNTTFSFEPPKDQKFDF
jgi:hypothetical protein